MPPLVKHTGRIAVHGLLVLMVMAILIIAVTADRNLSWATSAQEQELSPYVYNQVGEVREALALDNEHLASMGLSEPSAEAVLTIVRDFVVANDAQFKSVHDELRTSRREVARTMRRIHHGPRDAQLIARVPNVRQRLADAESARQRLIEQLEAPIVARLTDDEQTRWSTLRGNSALPREYQPAPAVSPEQAQKLLVHLVKGHQTKSELESTVLHETQRSVLRQARDLEAAAIDGVLRAEAKVLPPLSR